MGNLEKEINKIRTSKSEVDFNTIDKILISIGYTKRQGRHTVYTKDNCENIVIPTISGRKVKRRYVDLVIEEYDNQQ